MSQADDFEHARRALERLNYPRDGSYPDKLATWHEQGATATQVLMALLWNYGRRTPHSRRVAESMSHDPRDGAHAQNCLKCNQVRWRDYQAAANGKFADIRWYLRPFLWLLNGTCWLATHRSLTLPPEKF